MRSLMISLFLLGACFSHSAFATPQISDTVIFGGRKYTIREIPMLGFWDYGEESIGTGTRKPPAFDVRNSANWSGYRAQFEIRDSKLYLRHIAGWIEGKKRRNEQIINGKPFPIVADWYTGRIHLDVGDFDPDTQESQAVIIFHVEKGVITEMEFAKRMKPIWTWNGLPPKEPAERIDNN
jgi:hypothetical protein